MAAADASAHQPVDEDKATLLLAQTQQCSEYFRDFDFQQLLTLAHELSVLEFVEGEKIIVEDEQATFFGVILEGSLAPVRTRSAPTACVRSRRPRNTHQCADRQG